MLGCNLDNLNENPFYSEPNGSATLYLNDKEIEVVAYGRQSSINDSSFIVRISHLDGNLFIRSTLALQNIPKLEGEHILIHGLGSDVEGPGAMYSTYISDGDVVGEIFRYSSELGQSFVVVERYDSINQVVVGNYNVLLKRVYGNEASSNLNDTLNIKGDFVSSLF